MIYKEIWWCGVYFGDRKAKPGEVIDLGTKKAHTGIPDTETIISDADFFLTRAVTVADRGGTVIERAYTIDLTGAPIKENRYPLISEVTEFPSLGRWLKPHTGAVIFKP